MLLISGSLAPVHRSMQRQHPTGMSMTTPTEILICTKQDYNQILDDLHEFWGARDIRHLHHPFLIHEFGNSAFVIRREAQVVAYLFGFISQTEPVGYVHAVAVRMSARRQGLAHRLFHHFVQFAQQRGCRHVKAITTPKNLDSIAFHESLGMQLLGEPNIDGIPMIPDYAGRGAPRVVFLEVDLTHNAFTFRLHSVAPRMSHWADGRSVRRPCRPARAETRRGIPPTRRS